MLLILFILSFCIKPAAVRLPAIGDSNIGFKQVHVEEIPLSDIRCLQGGFLTTTWIDQKIKDDVYQEGVDTDYKETVICFKNLATTTATITKPGDLKIVATDLPINDPDCPQGGKKYESFVDVDGDSIYKSTVDTNYNSKKICNGLNGTASLSGANAGVVATALNTGDTQCPTGGFKQGHLMKIFFDLKQIL